MANLIQIDKINKAVTFSVAENVTIEEAQLFIAEYNSKMKTINPAEYSLEADCTSMQVLNPDKAQELTNIMKLYSETGFKKIIYKINKSSVLKMQLARIARTAGLADKVSIVEKA